MESQEKPNPHPRLIRLPAVVARTSLSRTTIWRRAGNDFPAPIHLGPKSTAWLESEVDAWLKSKIDARG